MRGTGCLALSAQGASMGNGRGAVKHVKRESLTYASRLSALKAAVGCCSSTDSIQIALWAL